MENGGLLMQKFVRGNQIVCSGTFTPISGTATSSAAEAVVVFTNEAGDETSETLTLANDGGVWTGVFDSRMCKDSTDQDVEWVIRSTAGILATAQGSFRILANKANAED